MKEGNRDMEKQMANQRTELKSKRIKEKYASAINSADAVSEAWRSLLKRDVTRKIYDVDPYAEVHQFRPGVYSILTDNLDSAGESSDPWIHLIVGTEKCMVIDNSYGLGNLKGLIDEITGGKPIIPCVTHMHYDHSYGSCQFDRVYCHEYEVQRLERTKNPHIWDYLFDENGKGIHVEFDRADLIPYRDYEIVGCPDGTVFDLGGCEVELVFLGGHTVGHAAYLDKRDRILFIGDDGIFGGISVRGPEPGEKNGESAYLHNFRERLAKIISRFSEYDSIFPGHGILDFRSTALLDELSTLDRILEDPSNYDSRLDEIRHGIPIVRYRKHVPGGTINYNPDAV